MVTNNLRLGGLATGMDTDSIVRDLMRVARIPLDKKIKEKQALQWKQADSRSLNLSILTLRNKAFDMRLENPYTSKMVSSKDESIVAASVTGSSVSGTYHIKVSQLATSATNASTAAISVDPDSPIDTTKSILSQATSFAAPGTFFQGKNTSDTFSVTVNSQNHTFTYGQSLDSILDTLNSDKTAGVNFFYDEGTDKIAVASTVTGAVAAISVSGTFLTGVLQLDNATEVAGQNAVFEFNGLQTSRASNTFTINGIELSLKGLTSGGLGGVATQIEVQSDTTSVYNNIKAFVDLYNETIESIHGKLKEEGFRTYEPLTEEQKDAMSEKEIEQWEAKARSGLLRNDTTLSRMVSELRSLLASKVEGLTDFDTLAAIGITTGSYWENTNGKLNIDETKLKNALATHPEDIALIFNQDSTVSNEKGLARRIYDTLDITFKQITLESGTASALYDNSYTGKRLSRIDQEMSVMEKRLAALEDRYYRQYTAMEKAISSMNQQSTWLSAQLQSISGQQ